MTKRILARATILTALVLPAFGGAALAGPEWCDDGSPPPNDWGLRPTGGRSLESPTSWLRSTTEGQLTFEGDRPNVTSLRGGVATGMWRALDRAATKDPPRTGRHDRPSRAHDRDDD